MKCADFRSWAGSGAPSYTNHGVSANLNITTSLSIDAWVKMRQSSQNDRMIVFIRGVTTTNGYFFCITRNLTTAGKNTLGFVKGGVYAGDSTVDIINGALVHIAATYNSGTGDIIFYRNGVAVQTLNNAAAIVDPGAVNAYIGYTTAGGGVNGCIFSLNIYNRVLSLAEVNYNMNHPQDAIRRGRQLGVTQESWVGGVWKDLSPNGYDGTPTGVALNPYNNVAGRQVSV